MKKYVFTAASLTLLTFAMQAQQKEGKVTYERTDKMEFRMNINGEEQVMPQVRKNNFELNFTEHQSLWKAVEQDDNEGMTHSEDGGGMQIRMVVAGSNDVLYTNFETTKKTEKRELFDKTFIIDDSIHPMKWKMTGETKTILNHNCMKAVATQIKQTTRMIMNDGKMERKEITDTSAVVAWFTSDVPVATGPGEYQGQLPGLILEMDISNGKQTYIATAISEKADVASIKEPSGKKHYTPEEFKKESQKMMEEMQRNMQGGPGNRQVRFNN